jgi:transcriptional antiterminator RfaH
MVASYIVYLRRCDLPQRNNSQAAQMNSCSVRPIDLWSDTNWFAIHTKPRRDNFAATNVSSLGLETLLPRVKVHHFIRRATRTIIKPLFPGYFFARFCPQHSLELVKCARGVLRVISSGRFPIPVGDEVVREIQDRVEEDGLIQIRLQDLKPGDLVSIQEGPFEGLMGRVEREADDARRVTILLETLFNAARVLIEKRWLSAVSA